MEKMYYIGLDIHKKMIAWCLKDHSGCFVKQGEVKTTRSALQERVAYLPQPWVAAMEATLFTGWACSRNVTWRLGRSENCAGCCGFGTFWCGRRFA